MTDKILVLGSSGQIGTELVMKLRDIYGNSNVIASDIKEPIKEVKESGHFVILDGKSKEDIYKVIKDNNINQVYLLAAMLSATAEKYIDAAWNLNMDTLLNVLNLAKEKVIQKVFWPSSIAVFGQNTPSIMTPQHTVMDPTTVYGISKLAGERWCEYYNAKYGVDVRSIRYPGIISWKTEPGGGTTDYAVDIFHQALKHKKYISFLSENTELPMMYMPDALNATLQLMEATESNIKIRSSYNVAAISFTPSQLADEIKKYIIDFEIFYKSDFRQQIADSWPKSIDDKIAQNDWGWKYKFNLAEMTNDMILNLKKK